MGRILKKRPESAPSNWQAVLTEMEINDACGKHGKIDPVGTDEIDPVKTA